MNDTLLQAAPGWSADWLVKPTGYSGANGIRFAPDGRLYVAEAFSGRITGIDIATGSIDRIDSVGSDIASPDDLAFDTRGNLYATEYMHRRVSVRAPNGRSQVLADDLPAANGLTIHQDRIFVNEARTGGRLLELHVDGRPPRVIAENLDGPNAMAVGPDGLLYFPCGPAGEIWRASMDGCVLERVLGGLGHPTAVKFDAHGLMHFTCADGMLATFDPQQSLLAAMAQLSPGLDNLDFGSDGAIYVSNFTDGAIIACGRDGNTRSVVPGAMLGPFGVHGLADGTVLAADGITTARVDLEGRVMRDTFVSAQPTVPWMRSVTQGCDGRIFVSGPSGMLVELSADGRAACLARDLDQPMELLAGAAGRVIIAESGTGRVLAVDACGGSTILASGLNGPAGLAISAAGEICISEASAGCVTAVAGSARRCLVRDLADPHGLAVDGDTLYILDRGAGAVLAHSISTGRTETIAQGLTAGQDGEARRSIPPGFDDVTIMRGPLLPYAGLTVLADGSVCASSDRDGGIVRISRDLELVR